MPTSYALPPWLRGNTPGELGQLAHAGAQLQIEKARMAQQAQLEQTRMAVQAEQANQQHEQQQAQMETEKAYRTIQTTLKQRELDQAGQMIQARTQAAAQKFQAQQQYQQAIASGMDPEQAIMQFGPAMGQSSSSVAIAQGKAARMGAQIPASIADEQHADQDFVKVTQHNGRTTLQQVHKPAPKQIDPELRQYRKEAMRLRIQNAQLKLSQDLGFTIGQTELPEKGPNGKPTSDRTKASFKTFLAESAKLDEALKRIDSGAASTTGLKNFRYDQKTGKMQPVEADQPEQSQDPAEGE